METYKRIGGQSMKRSVLFLLLSFFVLSGYSQDKGTEKTLAKAQGGNAKAQYQIGWYYGNGAKGFVRNGLKAIEWLEKSAENNYHPAQYYLGWFYFYGYGVKKDINKATYWYEKAAAQGSKEAKQMLKACQLHSNK